MQHLDHKTSFSTSFLTEKPHKVTDEKPATVKEGCVNLMGNSVLL